MFLLHLKHEIYLYSNALYADVCLRTLVISGAPRASEATYLRKFGNLSTREILVITRPYASPSAPQENQCVMSNFLPSVGICNPYIHNI